MGVGSQIFTTQWFGKIERALVGLSVATATEKKAGKVGGGV
jgi:hypothetical protein